MFRSTPSRHLSPDCLHVDREQRLGAGHEQPVLFGAAEAEVRAGGGEVNFADEGAVRREAVHAVVAVSGPAGPRPQVAVHVGADPVRGAGVQVGEGASIRDTVAIHVENANMGSIT